MTRIFDILLTVFGLILLSPVFIFIYLLIRIESKGVGFYAQTRVGKDGKDFQMYKFRSMRMNADAGNNLLTIGNKDPRVTNTGYFLRKYKLDELPQLFNVLTGDMSLVGPRPEVRKYVDLYNDEQRKVLSIRPGITDYASIEYIDENHILSVSANPEKTYINEIMPEKIKYNMKYIENQSINEYLKIIGLTFIKLTK